MRPTVVIQFAPARAHEIALQGEPLPADEARQWLDAQFIAEDCEPLRASGKVLTADKVLALARAVAPTRFGADAAWAQAFAGATIGALGRPLVTVDLEAGAIKF